MAHEDSNRLREYLTLVAGGKAEVEGVVRAAMRPSGEEGVSGPGLMGGEDRMGRVDAAAAQLRDVMAGGNQPPNVLAELEAIVNEEIRPVIDIAGTSYAEVEHPLWQSLNVAVTRSTIEGRLPSIGRVELTGGGVPYVGTGFVVGEGLLMTNRHVAQAFATGLGVRNLKFKPDLRSGLNFGHAPLSDPSATLEISAVVMIHPYWDMALLRVKGLPAQCKPLTLAVEDARDLSGQEICVVGYPAFDPRNPASVQNQLFNDKYGTKRLQPGELKGAVSVASFGKMVNAAGHDCSTLGGNSGSCVIDLASGNVLALHFGGAYHKVNYGVPASELALDSRVVAAGVVFNTNPAGSGNTWGAYWAQLDGDESQVASRGSPAANVSPPRPMVTPNARSGAVSIQIPLQITVSLGMPEAPSLTVTRVEAAEDSAEAMRAPYHDESYEGRAGYDEQFLGEESAFRVPLPNAHTPSQLAPTKEGPPLLHYQNFSIAMHAKRRLALFCASNVTKEAALRKPEKGADYTRAGLSGLGKSDTELWYPDPRLDEKYQLPDAFFTKDRGAFDKGHIVRRDDIAWGATYDELRRANGDSYHVTNCSPQVEGFNRSGSGEDNWGDLENDVLSAASSERLCVFAGPVLDEADGRFTASLNKGVSLQARVPRRFWKVVVARVEDGLAAFGFILEQDLADVELEFVTATEFVPFMYPLAEIQELTGVDFPAEVLAVDQFDQYRGNELNSRNVRRRRKP